MTLLKSLARKGSPLAQQDAQLKWLEGGLFQEGLPTFKAKLEMHGQLPLQPTKLEIFQVNLGYMCNQTCKHCHVDAGPDRTEIMTRATMQKCLDILSEHRFQTLDLTGGAPEMNPDFRWFVEQARPLVDELIVRSNLTIIEANKKYHDLPQFFAKHRVRVVSSLPFYNADKTDRQRGEGVFKKSIEALQRLNKVGYAHEETGLHIDLAYNPTGAFLPAPQMALEKEFKSTLLDEFDVRFNQLLCITNLPISRFLEFLIRTENFEEYMMKLVEAFNPGAVEGVMCRNTLSVSWQGDIYDCDFNQMLDLKPDSTAPQHIDDFDINALHNREISLHQHCYGCTAGAGSSCQGSLV